MGTQGGADGSRPDSDVLRFGGLRQGSRADNGERPAAHAAERTRDGSALRAVGPRAMRRVPRAADAGHLRARTTPPGTAASSRANTRSRPRSTTRSRSTCESPRSLLGSTRGWPNCSTRRTLTPHAKLSRWPVRLTTRARPGPRGSLERRSRAMSLSRTRFAAWSSALTHRKPPRRSHRCLT